MNTFIFTLSCPDKKGIVAAISNHLLTQDANIVESAQYSDPSTHSFFMRVVFESKSSEQKLSEGFQNLADSFSMKYHLQNKSRKTKTLILVSKASHCLNDLLHRVYSNQLPIEIPAIVSNHETLEKMASWHQTPFHHLPIENKDKDSQEQKILDLIDNLDIELVILARYMQILSPNFCEKVHGKAINIHHSFLPSFKGAKPYFQAYDRGVKLIGATSHYVTENLDEGPIIEQEVIRVNHTYTPQMLTKVGNDVESLVLAKAIEYHVERRVMIDGNKTVVFN